VGPVRAGQCQPGDIVKRGTVTGYVVAGIAGKVAVQPLSDGERIGLDWRAVWLDPDDEVTPVLPASEAREPKPEPPKGEQP
jgi:NMD protein affecting ribosome stability and mRNA decay